MAESWRQYLLRDVYLTDEVLYVGSYTKVTKGTIAEAPCAVRTSLGHEGHILHICLHECRIMSSLRHPNIVQFLGLLSMPQSHDLGFVTELMASDLHTLLEDQPNIPLCFKHSFLSDVAKGLAYLHSESVQIIHGDLSATNIFLTSGMVTKIGDFGAAQQAHTTDALTIYPGVPIYMPPEASIEDLQYGIPLDVFSFGVVALFTLTQCFPAPIEPPIYKDFLGRYIFRSEFERRAKYMRTLYIQFEVEHPLVVMVTECLKNDPASRPTINLVISMLDHVRSSCYDEEIEANKLQLYLRKKESSQDVSSLQLQRDDLKIINAQLVSDRRENLQILLQEKEKEMQYCQESLDSLRSQLAVTDNLSDGNATDNLNPQARNESNLAYGFLQCTPKMKDLLSAVACVKNWEKFGYELGLEETSVNRIGRDHHSDTLHCLTNICIEWLRSDPQANWEKALSALRSVCTCQGRCADKVFCKLSGSEAEGGQCENVSLHDKRNDSEMASTLPDGYLDSEPELQILLKEVAALTLKPNWEHIGIALGLPPPVISRINYDKHDTYDAFQLMFDEWLQRGEQRTWRDVIQALEEKYVNEKALAFRLRSKLQRSASIAQQSFTTIKQRTKQLHSITTESMQRSFLQETHGYHSIKTIASVPTPSAMLVPASEINTPISRPRTKLLDSSQYMPASELKKPIPKPRSKQLHGPQYRYSISPKYTAELESTTDSSH